MKQTPLIHVGGWLLYGWLTQLANAYVQPALSYIDVLLVMLWLAPVFYAVWYILRYHCVSQRYLVGTGLWLFSFFPLAAVSYPIIYHVLPRFGVFLYSEGSVFNMPEYLTTIALSYLKISSYAVVAELMRRSIQAGRQRIHDRSQYRKMKKDHLHYQINTHFQNNALTAIAAQALDNRGEVTAMMIGRFGGLQRYCMEMVDYRLGLVALEREVEQLESLMQLVHLRYDSDKVMQLEVCGKYTGQLIPPVTLLTFVENTLKYGTITAATPVMIRLELTADGYCFYVCNRVQKEEVIQHDRQQTIGISNVMQRLDLLLPQQYQLSAEKHDDDFIVELRVTQHGHGKKKKD